MVNIFTVARNKWEKTTSENLYKHSLASFGSATYAAMAAVALQGTTIAPIFTTLAGVMAVAGTTEWGLAKIKEKQALSR